MHSGRADVCTILTPVIDLVDGFAHPWPSQTTAIRSMALPRGTCSPWQWFGNVDNNHLLFSTAESLSGDPTAVVPRRTLT